MKRATDHPASLRYDSLGEDTRALDHLARRASSEREQEDPVGRDALSQ
jgi:hypothetical protein